MKKRSTYIIGEIGQNHNGSVDIAKLIIDSAARPIKEALFDIDLPSLDAVKFTKRDLEQELTDSMMRRPYESPNSFGKTYGEHRAFLELDDIQHYELFQYAKGKGLDFVETLCAPGCLSLLKLFEPDYLKVASRDLTNLPLLDLMAQTMLPIIISTGMASEAQLEEAILTITKHHQKITILHCVSQYPTHPDNVNLNTIPYLRKKYGSHYTIGYSDHTIGISTPLAAVAMGARVIEKHITLDRRMKGTDQSGSLGPDGLFRMARDIRLYERSLGEEEIFICNDVASSRIKLERSIASRRDLSAGEMIKDEDIWLLSPGDGFPWSSREQVLGKKVIQDIPKNEIIYPQFIES